MTSRVLVAVTAVLAVGAIAGCSDTVTGTVAMTTEPGASLSTRSSPQRTPGSRSPNPRVPSNAPGNAQSITCGEFLTLSPQDQATVVAEIFGTPADNSAGIDTSMLGEVAAELCNIVPKDAKLAEIVFGTPP